MRLLNPDLIQTRKEAELLNLDLARGTIHAKEGGGYIVRFGPPLFDISATLHNAPTETECENAAQAEYTFLIGLRQIQLAERRQCRIGRVYGLSNSEFNSRPLSDLEVAEYKASIAHAAEIKRLSRELAALIEQNAAAVKAGAGAAELASRYGLALNKPAAVEPAEAALALPSAKPQRAPSRSKRA
jgi:hypothetical protein